MLQRKNVSVNNFRCSVIRLRRPARAYPARGPRRGMARRAQPAHRGRDDGRRPPYGRAAVRRWRVERRAGRPAGKGLNAGSVSSADAGEGRAEGSARLDGEKDPRPPAGGRRALTNLTLSEESLDEHTANP